MTAIHLSSRHGSRADVAYDQDDWRRRSACLKEDPELFFPVGNSGLAQQQAETAKMVCSRCPVLAECREWAMSNLQQEGVCGGMTEGERRGVGRRGEYLRGRAMLNQGRDLALAHGVEVICAKLEGQDERAIARWSGVSPFAVRHALRLLVPQESLRGDATPLERLLASADTLREMTAAGRTDMEISRMFRTHAPIVADARMILDHRAAAADRIELTA